MDYSEVSQPEFGERLHRLRVERKLSQKALAADSMTSSYISLLEHGRRIPTLDVVLRLAQLLDVAPQELVGSDMAGLISSLSTGVASSSLSVDSADIRRLTETSDFEAAASALSVRLAALREQGDSQRVLDTGMELLELFAVADRHEERLALLDELSDLLAARQSDTLRMSVLVNRASALRDLGRLTDAREAAQDATRLLDGSASPPTPEHVRTLGVLASVLSELGEFSTIEGVVSEMLSVAAILGHQGVLGRAQWVASMVRNRMGQHELAFEHLLQSRTALAYESMPVRDWLRFCRFNASILLDAGQSPTAALEWIQAGEATSIMTNLRSEQIATSRVRARYELVTGNTSAAIRLYTELLQEPAVSDERLTALLGLSEALERSGREDEAVQCLREAAKVSEDSSNYRRAAEVWRHIDELRERQSAKLSQTRSGQRKTTVR